MVVWGFYSATLQRRVSFMLSQVSSAVWGVLLGAMLPAKISAVLWATLTAVQSFLQSVPKLRLHPGRHMSNYSLKTIKVLILRKANSFNEDRHSTEIAIFCPTFELAKTVCECFSLGGLKLDGQVAEVQVWVALSSAHLEDNRRQVDLYGRPCSPGRGPARSESNAKHRTIPSQ